MNFVNLHAHSSYSVDAIAMPDQMVKRVKELGQTALAITDHGTCGSYIELYESAINNGIKPIFGNEIYLDYDGKLYHATLLAKNKIGYTNLILMNNEAHKNIIVKGKNNKFPVTTIDLLSTYSEGIISLTGCPSSAFYRNSNFHNNTYDKDSLLDSLEYVKLLRNIFSSENVYYELMFSMDQPHYQVIFDSYEQIKMPIIYTSDSHFIRPEQKTIHQATVWMKKGYSYESETLWLKSAEEAKNHIQGKLETKVTLVETINDSFIDEIVKEENPYQHYLDNAEEYVNNTQILADTIEGFDITEKPTLPKIKKKEIDEFVDKLKLRLEEDNQFFIELFAKYGQIYNLKQDKVDEFLNRNKEQFEFELKILKDLKFLEYFYIINDLTEFCNKQDIFIRARGSAGGSLITYLIGIMPVNPLLFDLKFGRFINYERKDYPDCDVDVEPNRRQEVFDYMKEKWGMIGVTAYNMCSHKTIIHDICRYFKDKLNNEIDSTLEHNAVEYGEESEAFKQFLALDSKIPLIYNSMLDTIRHRGKHAAAIASPQTIAPIENWGDIPTLAWSESGAGKKELSTAGLVKIDILGVDCLDKIKSAQKLTGIKFNYYENDLSWLKQFTDDKLPISPIFELFAKGETTGIFQFLSNVAIKLAVDVKPESLNDLSAVIALNRPNMLEAGLSFEFSKFKQKPRLLEPRIDEVLKDSYGTLLYQEDMMSLYSIITGEGQAGADTARKVLSPKHFSVIETQEWKDKAEKLRKKFFTNGLNQGFEESLLTMLWNEILKYGRYGFNRSHSVVYAYNGLEQAFYKYYYPNEYYTGLLNYTKYSEKGRYDIQNYLYEAAENNVKVVKPNVNNSEIAEYIYNKEEGKIYLPLMSIKGIGETVAEVIYNNRPYLNINDFMEKFPATTKPFTKKQLKELGLTEQPEKKKHPVNVGVRQTLYDAGALKNLEGDQTLLELKEYNNEVNNFDIFGFHLLSVKLVNYIKEQRASGNVCGFISEITEKTSVNGNKFNIFRVFPSQFMMTFNQDLIKNIKLNDLCVATIDKKYNSILVYKKINTK